MGGDLLRLAAAQSASVWNGLGENVARHCALAELAASRRAAFVVFPELSLSGYPDDAAPAPVAPDDERLAPLRTLAVRERIVISAGAPVLLDGALRITVLNFLPDGSVRAQAKARLHPGEERFFAPGRAGPPLRVRDASVAIAICAESGYRDHAEAAARAGAGVYAISALHSVGGYTQAADRLGRWSAELGLAVLLANHGARSGAYEAAGRSALWGPSGECLARAPDKGGAVVVGERGAQGWTAEVLVA